MGLDPSGTGNPAANRWLAAPALAALGELGGALVTGLLLGLWAHEALHVARGGVWDGSSLVITVVWVPVLLLPAWLAVMVGRKLARQRGNAPVLSAGRQRALNALCFVCGLLAATWRGPHVAPAPDPASEARALFMAGRLEDGLAAAERVPPGPSRDLLFADASRESGWNLCAHIGAAELRQRCEVNLGRPHLRLPAVGGDGAGGSAAASASGDVAACDSLAPDLRAACLAQRSETAALPEAGEACFAMQEEDARGECQVRWAERLLDAGRSTEAQLVCGGIAEGRWRDDCHFRLAERLVDLSASQRRALCQRAGSYAHFCAMHLASQAANEAMLGLTGGSFDSAMGTLAGVARDWVPRVAAGDEQAQELAREFWVQALHDLLMEAGSQEDLARWRALGAAIDDEGVRALFQDLLPMVWARIQLESSEGSAGLHTWLARYQAAMADGTVELRAPSEPLLLPAQPESAVHHAPGRMPSPLEPRLGCKLSAAQRTGIALMWGLGPLPWSDSQALLEGTLFSPDTAVRVAAMELVEEKAWGWLHAEGAPPAWVGRALSDMAKEGCCPEALAVRARELGATFNSGARAPLWQLPAAQVCP